ncbi:MAG: ankyrin repeat domain-containing protein [Proteobacteria bacterium]|nr:ankyrin repeat domain-containing protein [Pseudomonadota bacterium]
MGPRKRLALINIAVALIVLCGFSSSDGVATSRAADSGVEEKIDPRMLEVKAAARIRDYEKMFLLLKPMSIEGDPEAMYQLSGLYRTGKGVEKDVYLAYQWMKKSADKGHKNAIAGLEAMVKKGWDTPRPDSGAAPGKDERAWYFAESDRKKADQDEGGDLNLWQDGRLAEDAFRWAARKGQLEKVRQYVEAGIDVNDVGDNGRTALMEAASFAHAEVVLYLLQKEARHDMRDRYGNDALLALIHGGKAEKLAETLTHLINYGADPESLDANGNTPLLVATGKGLDDAVKILLARKVAIHTRDEKGRTAVQLAEMRGHQGVVRLLLRHGAVLEKKAEDRHRSPVILAEDLQTPPAVKKIASKDILPTKGWSTLMVVCWRGNIKVVEALLAQGVELDWQDEEGHTALSRAAWQGHDKIVALLLSAGAKTEIRQRNGMTALSWAAQEGALATVRLLIQYGAVVNLRHEDGNSPLFAAVAGKHPQTAAALLAAGAKANIKNKDGLTPLLLAVREGQAETVQALLQSGADVNTSGPGEQTALWFAAENGNSEIIKMLVTGKADVDLADIDGQTPLFMAAAEGWSDVVQELLRAGASVSKASKLGNTPLMAAAMNGHHQVVKLLVGEYPDVDLKNLHGDTALMLAVAAGHVATAEALLAAGAGPYKKNMKKESARQLAEGNKEMLAVIEKHGVGSTLRKVFSLPAK